MNKIPIVMAFDENYAMNACVAVYSALKSKKIETCYSFYFLVRTGLPIDVTKNFYKLLNQFQGTEIEYIIVGDRFDNAFISNHITIESYYRLLISELLPELDKCIYLDVDIIACDDLTELWNYEIGNSIIAGVRDALASKERYKDLKIPSPERYIQAGVLIINLKVIKNESLLSKFIEQIKNEYQYHDQDVLNKVCYNRITLLPLRFNVCFYLAVSKGDLESYYSPIEVEDALNNPVIIHYAGGIKPWNSSDDYALLSHLWYQAALESPYNYDHTKYMLKGRNDTDLKNSFYETQVNRYKNSISHKIGRVVTFLPRLLKRFINKNR
ncbi:MAG: glycosyltransferase family 8 protein [Oscillospiraceae bacterium]|jgi:lipopolysaccharide biosynthesis glycosyltransferase|nr:glycosyltransferase family 8 protein [Oscillospiraceae bacterium]